MRFFEVIPEHLAARQAGISSHAYGLCAALAERGHEVHALTGLVPFQGYVQPVLPFHLHPVRVQIPTNGVTLGFSELHQLLIAEAMCVAELSGRPDVLHVHGRFSTLLAATLKRLWNTPLVVTCHFVEKGIFDQVKGIFDQVKGEPPRDANMKLDAWLYEIADLVVCPSHSVLHELRVHCKVPSAKLTVIHNGTDMHFAACSTECRYLHKILAVNAKLVLYVGRLSGEKGPHVLLDAFKRLLNIMEGVRLVLTGGGPQLAELQDSVRKLRLNEHVVFTDHLAPAEVRQLYSICDVLVVPSLYEVFPLVTLEAMMYGVPIVASDVGGLGEMITHEEAGILVPPGDARALCEAVPASTVGYNARPKLGGWRTSASGGVLQLGGGVAQA